jgi:succinate dehydrogenase/fumarate reductase flavoprotein subunit
VDVSIIETDVLIIGAGMAGCRAAIEAHDRGVSVVLTTKGLLGRDAGATWMASHGYQCWGISPQDTLDVQVEDTLRCGWFLNNQENVYAFLAHVPDTARELVKWGGRYKMKDGQFLPDWQLGCSVKEGRSICRAAHPRGRLGYEYSRIFPPQITSRKIRVIEDMFIIDLLTMEDSVVGAVGIDIRNGGFKVVKAKATILATGGYQGLHKVSTGSHNLTGDGQAVALRAGVDMMDFEFNQTLPAALWPPQIAGSTIPFPLIVEWDAHMYNSRNERFMSQWDPLKMERSTRAVISRAIFHEIKDGRGSPHGGVYTGVTHKPQSFIEEKYREFEQNWRFTKLKEAGIDLSREYIETGYVLHYCHGGCNINTGCGTDKNGLYAIGECASGSKDGADRMMSNALPFCMAMGIISGREAEQRSRMVEMPEIDEAQLEGILATALAPLERHDGVRVFQAKAELQELMVRETGYGRNEEGLKYALAEIERYKEKYLPNLYVQNRAEKFNQEWINTLEFRNLLLVAECIVRSALHRTESRGLHDRWDYLNPDVDWLKNVHLRLVNGELEQWSTPVEFTYWQPEMDSKGEPWHKGVKVNDYQGWRAEPLHKGL